MKHTKVTKRTIYIYEFLFTEEEIHDISHAGTINDGDAIQGLVRSFKKTSMEIKKGRIQEGS